MFFVSQSLQYIHVTYSFDKILILFFSSILVDALCLKFDFSLHHRNNVLNIYSNKNNPASTQRPEDVP